MHSQIRPLFILAALFTCVSASAADEEQAGVQPAAAAPPAATTLPAGNDAPAAPTAKAADAAASTAGDGKEATVARVPSGYKVKVHNGETVYCRKSTPLGTRFPTEVCMTVDQYEQSVRQGDGLRQELTGKQKSYSINN